MARKIREGVKCEASLTDLYIKIKQRNLIRNKNECSRIAVYMLGGKCLCAPHASQVALKIIEENITWKMMAGLEKLNG